MISGTSPQRLRQCVRAAVFGGEIREQVRTALAESGIDPALLELELTESMLLDDESKAISIMSELKALGISIAIDDFGTGFSNLGALARLPVDRLKIDRSIIRDIETNEAAASIASAIIAMGQRLGLRVLAEGVETLGRWSFCAPIIVTICKAISSAGRCRRSMSASCSARGMRGITSPAMGKDMHQLAKGLSVAACNFRRDVWTRQSFACHQAPVLLPA